MNSNEFGLKDIVRQTINEMTMAEFATAKDKLPTLAHTDRAFRPGDILCRKINRFVRDEDGKLIRNANGNPRVFVADIFNTITKVEGNILTLDNGTTTTTSSTSLKCTDTWFAIWDSMQNKKSDEDEVFSGLTFDYAEMDGDLWVVVTNRIDASTHTSTKYKYQDVKNAKLGERLRGIPMSTSLHLELTGFWLKNGAVKPDKSKNPMPNSENVPKDFICLSNKSGVVAGNEMFGAWDIDKKNEICSQFPWLETTPALWSLSTIKKDKKYMSGKAQTCTPDNFKTEIV